MPLLYVFFHLPDTGCTDHQLSASAGKDETCSALDMWIRQFVPGSVKSEAG